MSFKELFSQSKGEPVEYKGKLIKLHDVIIFDSTYARIKLNFISTNSEYPQAIFLSVNKGHFSSDQFADEDQKAASNVALWEDEWKNKKDIIINIYSKDRKLSVYNGWMIKDHRGEMAEYYGYNGAALFTEDIPKGKIYYCNDGDPDDDFDDLIFKIEILE